MKTYKYIIIILCVVFANSLIAQDMEAYKLQMPETILEKGGPIYVETLTDLTPENVYAAIGENFRNEMVKGIQAESLAFDHNLPNLNPWMRTNLYTTTDNKDEANYVISGSYSITTDQSKSYNEKNAAETKDSIPYVYYEYTAKSSATITGNVLITDTESGNEVVNIPYTKELSDEDKKVMQHASVKSPDTFVGTLSDYFVQAFRYKFSAVKATFKYDFPKIKPDNKDLRKEFRQYKKDLKDLADEKKLNELYSMYVEIQQKEDSPEVNECIGMCYEILGNYTQAKSYYEKSNSMASKQRISEQINTQNQLRGLGFTIEEPEF